MDTLLTQNLNNLPGWLALIIIIIDRMIVPLMRQYIPVKSKSDTQRHAIDLENQHFNHEMKKREVEAQENIAQIIKIMDGRLVNVEGEVKTIREDVSTVIQRVGELGTKRTTRK